jgi:hypothetical protein
MRPIGGSSAAAEAQATAISGAHLRRGEYRFNDRRHTARNGGDIVRRMSWMAAALAGAACAGGLLVAGCSPAPCGTRPLATYDLRTLDDSTVTWSLQGSPSQTIGVVPGHSAGSDCAFANESGKIFPPLDGGADFVQGYFTLRCVGAGAGAFNFFVNSLGDFRSWSVGTFTMAAPQNAVGVDYVPNTARPAAAPPICNPAAWFDGIVLTVTVETATGAAAPYPTLVTDDFVRTFRLDFDTSTVQPRDNDGAACDLPVAAQVSLHLTQTAADYAYDPNAPRDCNAP